MNLVVEEDNLVDGQRQRPKSLQKEASDSFDNMLLPTSRIMRAATEKITQTSQRPRVLHHSQLCRRLRWRQRHVGLLCHRKCLMRARSRVFFWPRSVPQSCRLKGNRTQHLASVASGLSQSVPLVSFMPVSVDPSVSSTIFGLLYKHICPCCAWHYSSSSVAVVKHGACESDTEPRLHLRLAEPSVTAMSIILWLLFVKSSPGSASRSLIVGHPSGNKLCFLIQYTDCLLVGDCFGRKQRIAASCLEESP